MSLNFWVSSFSKFMDATLQALGGILLKAIPTLLLLIVVHFYLKFMFFNPLIAVLAKRREATEGARQAAESAMAKATSRAGEIEAALRKAREGIYQDQEKARKQLVEEQTKALDETRQKSHGLVHDARLQLVSETDAAKAELATYAKALSEQIAARLLTGRAA
jgi:F-type H+-transporting ATPase subunit b